MIYRRRASPLHAARATVGACWCLALMAVSLVTASPLVLGALLLTIALVAHAAGVGRQVGRAALFALPLAVAIAVINPIVTREGLTVLVRGETVPVLGRLDITLEAVVFGALLGLRVLVVMLCAALYSAAVDPDELLRALRRISPRSALTAALATRMVPVLGRDARRMAEAQRCRAAGPAGRTAVVRAVAAGTLERAVDVAATLELRGYATPRRSARLRRPWSRHDLAFAASALALLGLTVAVVAGGAPFEAYPLLDVGTAPLTLALCAAIVLCAVAPFADRRGIER